MRPLPRLIIASCVLALSILWYWPRIHSACAAGGESPSCSLVVDALGAAGKLKLGMLRADLEKDFDPDGGLSVQDRGTFTYRRCHYIKIDIEFKAHESEPNTYSFSPEDQVTKISKPYLAYPVSD